MENQAPPKKRSAFVTMLYIILAIVLVSVALQMMNVDVVSTRESDTMIERPHDD